MSDIPESSTCGNPGTHSNRLVANKPVLKVRGPMRPSRLSLFEHSFSWTGPSRRTPVVRLRCIDGAGSGSAASPPCSDSRCNAAIWSPPGGGGGASASICASFLEPNSGDFFPRRQFRVFSVCSACGGRLYRQGSPNTGRPGGIGPLPGCAAWTGPQGSTRPGRRAAGRAFPIAARSHAGDAPARCKRSPCLHAPLP